MNKVSYTQRDCTDKEKIEIFLLESRTGVIGMTSDEYPYAVPVNYVWHNGAVYFHGMGSGKKVKILSESPMVCFTVYKEHGTVTDPVPAHADTSYMSVMIFGRAEKVTDLEETTTILQKVLDKYMPKYYTKPLNSIFIEKYRSSLDGNAVSVYKVTPREMTAKENLVQSDKLFNLK